MFHIPASGSLTHFGILTTALLPARNYFGHVTIASSGGEDLVLLPGLEYVILSESTLANHALPLVDAYTHVPEQ
jgi:hypothetical protein